MKLPSPSPSEEQFSPKKLSSLLEQLKTHPSSYLFLEPVDPLKHNCPDYFEKIKQPMDLQKISERLEEYTDVKSFFDDVCLMLQNAFSYNPTGHFVRDHASKLGAFLDTLAIQLGHHIDWASLGIDLFENKRVNEEEEKPRKRRLGSYKLRQSETINSELESLSSTLETMNKQLARLEKEEKKPRTKPKLMVDTTPHSSEHSEEEVAPTKKKAKAKRVINPVPKADRRCEHCGTNETPMWRRGPSGKASLCNKCGVKWRAGRILQQPDGTILPPPSPTTLSRPIKSSKSNPTKRIQKSAPQSVSYAQKEHVAQVLTLGTLNSDQLSHIVNMIRNSVPELRNSSEEIELDIEALDPSLVAQMYRYVVETVGLKPMS